MWIWKNRSSHFEDSAMPHLEAVYRFSLYLCGNEADAEALTQECFHLAFRNFHQFRRDSNCRAWLFRIARNAHIDRLRRSSRQPRSVDTRNISSRLDPHAPEPSGDRLEDPEGWWTLSIDDEEVFYDMFGDEVNGILAELPKEFRLSVVLCDVEGFTYQEIGEVLGCPVGTVRSRIARARGHMRKRLFDYAKRLGYVRSDRD